MLGCSPVLGLREASTVTIKLVLSYTCLEIAAFRWSFSRVFVTPEAAFEFVGQEGWFILGRLPVSA